MICRLLVAKPRNLEMFKMAFQVVFIAKNVQRFSFEPLVAKKLKKQWGAIMPPQVTTSFQIPGKIGLTLTLILKLLRFQGFLMPDASCIHNKISKSNNENF